jgi:hypothetical protein
MSLFFSVFFSPSSDGADVRVLDVPQGADDGDQARVAHEVVPHEGGVQVLWETGRGNKTLQVNQGMQHLSSDRERVDR